MSDMDDAGWLERGWEWLKANEGHPDHSALFDRFLDRLRAYEKLYDDPPPVYEQATIGGEPAANA